MQNFSASEQTPKSVLRKIVHEEFGHTVTDFSKRCQYTYTHAWQLLEGEAEITDATLGRLIRAYGHKVAGRVADLMPALGGNGNEK